MTRVLVTGGAGYVGAVLVPHLLKKGLQVRVLDLYMYGEDALAPVRSNPNLEQVRGDIRDKGVVDTATRNCDMVIHLACISNDPSFELNPLLGKSINYDAFGPLVSISKRNGVRRFIYASSSSVYGVSDTPDVTEEHPLDPLTDYSKYKALCEPVLLEQGTADFVPVIVRPATVCGYSPRQRLDLIVNILTNHAITNRRILVFGGTQSRPNMHIDDMVDVYEMLLDLPNQRIAGKVYNVGYENYTVMDTALLVKGVVEGSLAGKTIEIVTTPTDDNRSYRISSGKICRELGYLPKRTVHDAVRELAAAFAKGLLPNSMTDKRYFNIKTMQALNLT